MSTPTDLETRIGAALAARAEQVTPQHLRHVGPPVVPLRRRTTPVLLLAAAASVLLAVVLTLVLPGDDRVSPAPEPKDPEVVLPPDVGQAWDRYPGTTRLDLDGDGAPDRVRFRAESQDGRGRVRVEAVLTRTGDTTYGVVDGADGFGVELPEAIDADDDGDDELVLFTSRGMTEVPLVLDLRDGLLVEAPPTEPTWLVRGQVTDPDGPEGLYVLAHASDFWIEDGALVSARSVNAFARTDPMTFFAPEEYVMDVVEWRLREDGVLVPGPAATPCLVHVPEGQRPCVAGETDALPVLAPVAGDTVGLGGSFTADTGAVDFTASLEAPAEADADADLVISQDPFPETRTPLRTGAEPLLFATQPTGLRYDGVAVLVASGDGDEPIAHQVLVQERNRMVALEPVGDVPLGTGYTDDRRAFRTWLTYNGDLVTAVADGPDEDGPWDVYTWFVTGQEAMAAAPLDTVCFDDPADPATARRC